jgi:hypothetical protein
MRCPGFSRSPETPRSHALPVVTFAALTHDDTQRKKVLLREEAVKFWKEKTSPPISLGIELALSAAVTHIYRRAQEENIADFPASTRTLREWIRKYDRHGLDGLVEQKQGRWAARA